MIELPWLRQPERFTDSVQTGPFAHPLVIWTPRSGVSPNLETGLGVREVGPVLAGSFSAGSSQFVDLGPMPVVGVVTFGAIYRTTQTDSFALSSRSSSGTAGFELAVGLGGVAGTNGARTLSSGAGLSTSLTGFSNAQFHHYTGRFNSTTLSLFADGVKATDSTGSAGTITSSQNLYIARRGSTYFTGGIALVYVFNRFLSDQDIYLLHTNPWRLFEPRRFYVKAASGGAKTSTSTLDAAIQEAKTATATLNAAIQTSNTSTATLDGVISQQRTSTATLDAAIQAALTATTTLNAAIQAAMTGTSTLDAVISAAGSTSLTATLDAAIQEAKSLTATLDAAIQTSGSASATLNAVVVQVNTATATLDATVQAVVTAYALLDAYIFDADAPVVEETRQGGAGRGKRRRYIMPDDSVVFATPSEAEQLVKLFVKPVEPKKSKRKVKTLNKLDLVEIKEASSDTVPTERIVVKPKAVWERTDLYQQALNLMAQRELLRKRREDELILLAA